MQLDSWDEDGRRITLAIEAVADADLAADAEVGSRDGASHKERVS
jgi:hypothetical protein